MELDCDFPGGNIVVDKIEGDTAFVHQDLRDTEGDWFYFYFRVRGAAGRAISVNFTRSKILGVRGPGVSLDGGNSWHWLGAGAAGDNASFSYCVPAEAEEVRFSFGFPYLEADLHKFLAQYGPDSGLRRESLCRTAKGRAVEALRFGNLAGRCAQRVALACRHHCCEMMASYALEGLMAEVLGNGTYGAWLHENVEFLAVPFVDKDGVEDGDQGKNRRPHDHGRDYADAQSIYPPVRAIKSRVSSWPCDAAMLAFDLHCPWIRGEHNQDIYFVGCRDQKLWARVESLCEVLEKVRRGPLPYLKERNLPFGQAWNTGCEPYQNYAGWMGSRPGNLLAASLEIPYADAGGQIVDAAGARLFGADLAAAIAVYLQRRTAGVGV